MSACVCACVCVVAVNARTCSEDECEFACRQDADEELIAVAIADMKEMR